MLIILVTAAGILAIIIIISSSSIVFNILSFLVAPALSHWRIFLLFLYVSRNNKSRIIRYTYRQQRHDNDGGVWLNPLCSSSLSPSSTRIGGSATAMTVAFGSILRVLFLLLLPVYVSAAAARR